MTQDSGRLEQLEQIARDGDAYWQRVVDKSKWRFVRLEASRSPSVAAALPHTEVKADPSKKENDAVEGVQANVRNLQAEADYQKQKLQAETEKKRLLQATADEEPAAVVQEEKTDAGVHPDHSKIENDAATRVQANVRKHQAEADYQRQKLQAEKRLLQATADEEPAIVEQQNMRMVDAQKQRKELTAERDADGISTT
jgi:small-conductance mechanosensitive channel